MENEEGAGDIKYDKRKEYGNSSGIEFFLLLFFYAASINAIVN